MFKFYFDGKKLCTYKKPEQEIKHFFLLLCMKQGQAKKSKTIINEYLFPTDETFADKWCPSDYDFLQFDGKIMKDYKVW